MSYLDRLAPGGQKKMPALHGGGVRGVITLQFLARVEATLRSETGAGQSFVLADYFDYIAGFNNPAFQLFLMATHDAYGLSWRTGENDLLLVSAGTGYAPDGRRPAPAGQAAAEQQVKAEHFALFT